MRVSAEAKVSVLGFVAIGVYLATLIGLSIKNANREPIDSGTMSEGYKSEFATFSQAAVAVGAPFCATIGKEIMADKGGSSTDAAIATAICLGTVVRSSAGVGGGNFMTIYDTRKGETEKSMVTITARETAPAAATEDMFVNTTDASTVGGLAVGVPGELMGFYQAWQMFGKIPWSDLITPSVNLAREGFNIPEYLAKDISDNEEFIRNQPNLAAILLLPNGSILKEGDLLVDEKFAVTLESIAEDPLSFYNGSLAEDIVADLAEYDAIITLDDLKNYMAAVKDPVTTTLYNGNLTVNAPPPPSSGVVLNYIMKLVDGFMMDNSSMSMLDDEILTYHRIVEAFKFGFAERSALGDADFVDVTEMLQNMTSDEYADAIRSRINDSATGEDIWWYNPSFESATDSGTAHVSLLGADGSAVAITSTINLAFGSKIRGSRTGIIFNNEMDDFSTPGTVNSFGLAASPSNFIAPGKRPMSSISPLIILNEEGQAILVSGGSGGPRIITATAFVAIHSLWLGDRIDAATNRYRIHHQLLPDAVRYEENFSRLVLAGLKTKGHELELLKHLSRVDSVHNVCPACGDICAGVECIHAVSDARKSEPPDGF